MSICPIIDGAVLPTRQNGKTLPCANLAVENAKLRELCGELYECSRQIGCDKCGYKDGCAMFDRMAQLGVDA